MGECIRQTHTAFPLFSWDGGGRGHTVPVLCFWCSQMVEGGFVESRVMLSSSRLEAQMIGPAWAE